MPEENPLFNLDDDALLKKLADLAELHARNILITEVEPDLEPFFHIVTPETNMLVVVPWENNQEKNIVVSVMRHALRERRAKAYCFTSECWLARYDKGDAPIDDFQRPKVMPKDHPNRIECVCIFASTHSKQAMRVLEMIRDPSGRIVDLKPNEHPAGEEKFTGTFPGLFEDAP